VGVLDSEREGGQNWIILGYEGFTFSFSEKASWAGRQYIFPAIYYVVGCF